jgi:RHS repeat-associated protein
MYSSQSGAGALGVGWSLTGLSSIYRCNQTTAQDAAPAPVALTYADRLCMDGKRLQRTGGTYGQDGSSYQTEIADFSNVTAHGAAGNGPAYFTVTARNGWTYEYGNTSDSRVLADGTTASSWMLDKVSDRAGNTMVITWKPADLNLKGTTVPKSISWTPTAYAASTYQYLMQFNYQAMPLAVTFGYLAGQPAQNFYSLTSIQIINSGTTIKDYFLSYTASNATGRQTLTQITECADSAQSNCLSPTTLAYQPGQAGIATTPSAVTGSNTVGGPFVAFDFNGDGINDIAYLDSAAGAWKVAFGSASGYSAPVTVPFTPGIVAIGNADGTAAAGFLVSQSGQLYYYKWNGSAFAQTTVPGGTYSVASPSLADVNGDGLPDLVYLDTNSELMVRLNTTASGVVQFASTPTDTGIGASLNLFAYQASLGGSQKLDFSGDGQADFVLWYQNGTNAWINVFHYPSGQWPLVTWGSGAGPGNLVDIGDYNNDACMDLLFSNQLQISACGGATGATLSLNGDTALGGIGWDGSGKKAVLVKHGTQLGIYKILYGSSGYSLSSLITTGLPPYDSTKTYSVLPNATGDGLDGLLAVNASGTPGPIQYFLHNGAGQPPDLLTSATDGYGNSVKPSYVALPQAGAATYAQWNDAQFPYVNYVGPLYLVNQAVFSDPTSATGGTYYQKYGYAGIWMNAQGRGLTPAGNVQTYDSRNAVAYTLAYQRAFPYTGMLSAKLDTGTQWTPWTNAILYYWFTTPASITLDSTPGSERFFPYFSDSTVQNYELGQTGTRLVRKSYTTYSQYDNYGNAASIVTTVTDEDSGTPSPYNGQSWVTTTANTFDIDVSGRQSTDVVSWCLPLLNQTVVTYTTLPVTTTVTRKKSFALDPATANCRYQSITTEPGSPYQVTETFGYDNSSSNSFGNLTSDTITGVGMTPRVTNISWVTASATTGQFPMSVTDPSGAMTQLNYDFNWGQVSSVKDPNNATSTWQYGDGFGRKTQENRPDGTYTQWTYNNCVNLGGCPLQNNALAVAQSDYAYGGSLISNGATYFDMAERPLVSNGMLLSGYYRNEVRYDNLGHIWKQYSPCAWTSVTTSCTYWTTNSYDLLDRLFQVQRPINSGTSNLQTTSYQYAGQTTTIVDPYNNTQTIVTDVNGWLRQTKDAYGYLVTLAYDAAGSKTSVTDSLGNTLWQSVGNSTYPTGYAYGIEPFLLGSTDADLGSRNYTYNALGEIIGWSDARNSFSARYDSLSRITDRYEPDLYSHWTWGSSASNHNWGKLASVCSGTGTNPTTCTAAPGYSEAETYDSLGRPYQRAISPPYVGTFTYTSQYDPATGLLSSLTYPTSINGCQFVVSYGYLSGILSSLTDASNPTYCQSTGTIFWQANTENPDGTIAKETLGNGIVTNRTYDAVTHWLQSIQAGVGGGTGVKSLSFLYDEMGNVIQRQDVKLGLTESACYDSDYRLDHTTATGLCSSPATLQIHYDSMGNISSRSDVSNTTWTYDPVRKHAVTQAGSNSYTYDGNGNMITRQGSTINWSSYNYPTSISAGTGSSAESVSLYYGPDRQRWYQYYSGNGTTEGTYYIGDLLEMVISGPVTDYRHYIYAGSEPVAVYSRATNGNTVHYVLSDHQGSVAAITNTSQGTLSESFTPYGIRRDSTTWSGPPPNADLTTSAGITRQAYTFQTGLGLWMNLNHMNGRVQDAMTGRFLSPDPYIPDPANAQDYNRYSYVDNNPLTLIDPSGFDDTCEINWGGVTDCGSETVTGSPSGGGGRGGGGDGAGGSGGQSGGGGGLGSTPWSPSQWGTVLSTPLATVGTQPGAGQPGAAARSWWNTPVTMEFCGRICAVTGQRPTVNTATWGERITNSVSAFAMLVPGTSLEAVGGRALVPAVDVVYATATERLVAGYNVWGTAGRVGSTYNVNILGLYGTKGSQGLGALVRALKAEAAAAGASRISIQGLAIINEGLAKLSAQAAARFGLQLERVNGNTIILSGTL